MKNKTDTETDKITATAKITLKNIKNLQQIKYRYILYNIIPVIARKISFLTVIITNLQAKLLHFQKNVFQIYIFT